MRQALHAGIEGVEAYERKGICLPTESAIIIKLTMHCAPRGRSQWGDRRVYHGLQSKGNNNHKEFSGQLRKGRQSSGTWFLDDFGSFMRACISNLRTRDEMDVEPRSEVPAFRWPRGNLEQVTDWPMGTNNWRALLN